jgi:mRNA interferase MazF
MTCDAFEAVAVPFPFTDSDQSVKRPAAVLSRRAFNAEGHTVMAMITDARNRPWPLDIRIDHRSAGCRCGFARSPCAGARCCSLLPKPP